MDLVHEFAVRENITYFLSDGSCLGSYRHHDLIPWDDDIDILIPEAQRVRFLTYFHNKPEPKLHRNSRWALYSRLSSNRIFKMTYCKALFVRGDLFFAFLLKSVSRGFNFSRFHNVVDFPPFNC